MTNHEPTVRRDDEAGRFVLEDAPEDGFLEFEQSGDRITLVHTEVADELEGQGIGSALVRSALEDAEERGLTIAVECQFVASWLDRHPERADELDLEAA